MKFSLLLILFLSFSLQAAEMVSSSLLRVADKTAFVFEKDSGLLKFINKKGVRSIHLKAQLEDGFYRLSAKSKYLCFDRWNSKVPASCFKSKKTNFPKGEIFGVVRSNDQKISLGQRAIRGDSVLIWLDEWKTSWQNGSIENYISHYSKDFNSQGRNLKRWQKEKKQKKANANQLRIHLENVNIFNHENHYLAVFEQKYMTDRYSDKGQKQLRFYKKLETGEFLILGESWQAL